MISRICVYIFCAISLLGIVAGKGQSRSTVISASAVQVGKATNTQACNGYPEFCSRAYNNITMVAAHNSPFDESNNAARNQDYGVITQLNDGVRMLTGQIHVLNGTLHYCHTSCSLLDAGPIVDYFRNISTWLAGNPHDVVTLLLVNSNQVSVQTFVGPIQSSGLAEYVYTPPSAPMEDWPTLSELILNNTRLVVFMDYEADQAAVPYIMDQFSQMWETPEDPTDRSFPCTVQRPPGLDTAQAANRMYLANHNLNLGYNISGLSIDIPDISVINQTNAVSGYGSLGLAVETCIGMNIPTATIGTDWLC